MMITVTEVSLVSLLSYLFGYQMHVQGSRWLFGVDDLVLTWVSATKIKFWWKICTF